MKICKRSEMDDNVPGEVYLCQVNAHLSCGACCGLYNVANASRDAMTKMLIYRTRVFAKVPRDMDAILEFKRMIESKEDQKRPYPKFHHCPYIGLVGEDYSRVGCLLHPLCEGNKGTDFRGLSFYGGMACGFYFCPTYRNLAKTYKEILREVSEHWYLYGLIVTEEKMLGEFFGEVEKRMGRLLKKEDIVGNKNAEEAVQKFLRLKIYWPFRLRPGNGMCNYFFEDQLYSKPLINYKAIGVSSSRYDVFLRGLVSLFRTEDELHRAENILDQLFDRLILSIS